MVWCLQGFEDCLVLSEILDKYNNDFGELIFIISSSSSCFLFIAHTVMICMVGGSQPIICLCSSILHVITFVGYWLIKFVQDSL